MITLSTTISAQVPFWSNNGNNAASNDFLGTTNNQPLIFKTNGLEVMRLNPNGTVKFNSFMNMGNGVMWSSNGTLSMTPFPNDSNKVYTGNGTFRSISSMSGWSLNGNLLYSSPGTNVGIGITNPAYALEVNGSAYFHGTVFATGIVLANKVEVDTLKSADMISINNNLNMKGGSFNEFYTTTGDLRIQSNASSTGNTIFNAGYSGNVGIGTSSPQYKLDVQGNMNVSNELNVFRILSNAGDSIIRLGDSSIYINYGWGNIANMNTTINSPFRGMGIGELAFGKGLHSNAIGYRVSANGENSVIIGSRSSGYLNNNTPNSLMVGFESNLASFYVGPSNGTGTVGRVGVGTSNPQSDFQIGDHANKLSIGGASGVQNTFSTAYIGFNVARNGNNNWLASTDGVNNGGVIMMGDIQGNLRIVQLPSSGDYQDRNWTNQQVEEHTVLKINYNGRVVIGENTQAGGPLDDPNTRLTVDGGIACRKLNVTLNNWADSVFAPSFYLMPLDSVATFIGTNGHLPGVPTENDVRANGSDLAQNDVILLAKVEELTLYVIQMNQRILELEKQNAELQNQLKGEE